jgi:hypothetical protein
MVSLQIFSASMNLPNPKRASAIPLVATLNDL